MAKEIKNKIVAITGAADGIGFQTADKFLAKQAKIVVILDINEQQGKEAINQLNAKHGNGRAEFVKCDVTKDVDNVFKTLIEKFKKIDVFINNAGILNDKLPRKTIEINVTAVVEFSLKLTEHMRKDKGGHGGTIINLSSTYGFQIDQFLPTYQASKFAVVGLTKSLGHPYNYNKTGVRVVAICPGATRTKLASNTGTLWDDASTNDLKKVNETQDWQDPDDVAKAAVDAFEKADSGTIWLIEGGRPIVEVVLSHHTR